MPPISIGGSASVSADASLSLDAGSSLDAGISLGASMGSPGSPPPDPYMAFRFSVFLDSSSAPVCGFTDVTGLGAETDVQTLRVGGVNDAEVQLPGPTKFSSRLVLKRGLADERQLWHWYAQIIQGAVQRKDVTIMLKSSDGQRSTAWTFRAACPVKWTGPELHAITSAVAFESIELVHRGFLIGPG